MVMATSKRPRISFDSAEKYRRAVNIWAARNGKKREDWFETMVREHLSKELAEAEAAMKEEHEEARVKPKR
jgi:hypothetical protein